MKKASLARKRALNATLCVFLALVMLMSVPLSGSLALTAKAKGRTYWLEDEFRKPDSSDKLIKLWYYFDENYAEIIDLAYNHYGYGGITTNVKLDENYLKDDDAFALLDEAFSQCISKGLTQLWIYDEYQWPSGSAYGMVTENAPEYEPTGLAMIEENGTGAQVYELGDEYMEIRHALIIVDGEERPVSFDDKTVRIDVEGEWTLRVFATYCAWVERDTLMDWQHGKPYINIMSRGAVSKFISVTHEQYKEKLPKSFDSVEAFFTDEPSLWTSNMTNHIHTGGTLGEKLVPWEDSLPRIFKEMHGWDLYDRIGSLYSGDEVEDRIVRIQFYETVGQMIADNYFGQINEWCEANGKEGSGHMLLEEKLAYHTALYGDLMKCMKASGYPGCDLLQVSPELLMSSTTAIGSFAGIKMASSAARNTGKKHVLAEYNPEASDDPHFKADKMGTSLAGAAITRMYGADKIVLLNPQESYTEEEATLLSNFVGRLNVMLKDARMNSGIAVYYPISTIQGLMKAGDLYEGKLSDISERYNYLCTLLLREGLDYNYLDDESILSGTINKGKMTCGDAQYRVIVMPYTQALDPAVLDKLIEFRSSGGVVLWTDALPEYPSTLDADDSFYEKLASFSDQIVPLNNGETFGYLVDTLRSVMRYGFRVNGSWQVVWSPYIKDGRQIIVATNTQPEEKNISVDFGTLGYSVYNPVDGSIKRVYDSKVTLKGYETLIFVSTRAKETKTNPNYIIKTYDEEPDTLWWKIRKHFRHLWEDILFYLPF